MDKVPTTFRIVFHNLQHRSWIECSLCWECPRGDRKGCCYYNPTFYPVDFVYLAEHFPEWIPKILDQPRVTRTEKYVGVDRRQDNDGDFRCPFHTLEQGCLMIPEQRESVCRQYVCPGCRIWERPETERWQEFFARVDQVEAEINAAISRELEAQGLNLRNCPERFIAEAVGYYRQHCRHSFDWCRQYPEKAEYILTRPEPTDRIWEI